MPRIDITLTIAEIPEPEGHAFERPSEDCAEICTCGAAFFDGFNLQAVKIAHLAHFAAEQAR